MTEVKSGGRLRTYIDWVRTCALPIWAERGWDACKGRFRERLDLRGDALALPHRAMLQARQIYVYAQAARLGWFEKGGRLAEIAMASLLRDFCHLERGRARFAFSIDPASGRVVSPVADSYAHAFVLFSLAALYRLNGNSSLLETADATIRFLREEMTDRVNGGLFDALPVTSTLKRQNPHMHLLEAFLALEEAAPGRGYGAGAVELINLFDRRFFVTPPGVLLEHFTANWSDCPVRALAGIWEPGHHFEWVWLLHEAQRLTGMATGLWSSTLYDVARRHGSAPGGLIYDELQLELQVVKSSHRLWPHTEAIKAAVARCGSGDPAAPAFAEAMAGHLLDTFLERPFPGGWIDQISSDGSPLVKQVPASSLYHLVFAASEATKLPSRAAAAN